MGISLPSPAKLNLFLHIVGRRPDGYHEIQTIFQFLDWSDALSFKLRKDGQLKLHTDLNFPPEENLIWHAAKQLQQHTQTTRGADIYLKKKLPIGAGLGGGSSNAATTLHGLNFLWETQLPIDVLLAIGRTLGADVPIFVHGNASWAEGIGEQLTTLSWPEDWYVVLIPPISINTANIFAHPDLTRNTPRIKRADFRVDLVGLKHTHNDFEPLVRRLYPLVGEALDWLSRHSLDPARLTGSGSAVFARFSNQQSAEQVFGQKPIMFEGFVARSLNRSPLFLQRFPKIGNPFLD